MSRILYDHIPEDLPPGWVRSSYVPATHYQNWYLWNQSNEFQDVFLRYLSLKDPNTALVRACARPPRPLDASLKEERDQLFQRRAVFMGEDERPGGNWDARMRSWLGISDKSTAEQPVVFSKKIMPIKRESLEELLWRLGLQPYDLPEEGWCGRTPYHSSERNYRHGQGNLPRKLPKGLKEKLLKPLKAENPELKNLTERELAAILYLLKVNPPYPMSREINLDDLTEEQKSRRAREDQLQKTRIITQYFAAIEKRALEMLRKELEEDLG